MATSPMNTTFNRWINITMILMQEAGICIQIINPLSICGRNTTINIPNM